MEHTETLWCICRPYGFLDRYDPGYVCNHSDDSGRYDYQSQPSICRWNCLKLAEAIQGALPLSKAKQELEIFDQEFDRWIANSAKRVSCRIAALYFHLRHIPPQCSLRYCASIRLAVLSTLFRKQVTCD